MSWRVETTEKPILPLLHVIHCQDAWRRLTPVSRAALVLLSDDPSATVHPATVKALRAHGLLDDDGLTAAGRQVVKWRPDEEVTT